MKEIPLTRGLVALVDDDDYETLSRYKWFANVGAKGNFYAARMSRDAANARKTVFMHRVLLNPPPAIWVDHVDFNGLNNQRRNLRLATVAENKRHARMPSNNTSNFKGVCLYRNKWRARINDSWLGVFATKEAAARCYDDAIIQRFGEFGVTNASLNLYPTQTI
jgi:hypothetical protein